MVRWELIFFLVVLASSAAGTLMPEGSMALLASKGMFALAFVLFAGSLFRSRPVDQNTSGQARRRVAKPI